MNRNKTGSVHPPTCLNCKLSSLTIRTNFRPTVLSTYTQHPTGLYESDRAVGHQSCQGFVPHDVLVPLLKVHDFLPATEKRYAI